MKIEIKSRWDGAVLFACEAESLRLAVELAVSSGARLDGARLDYVSLDHASLDHASLDHASLKYTNLDHASLKYASLKYASLDHASLKYTNLDHASLKYAGLKYARLDHARLDHASLDHASLDHASLDHASLDHARLDGTSSISPHRCTPLLMLFDQPGLIRAYKLVNANSIGPFNGGIKYEIGGSYDVANANTDVGEQCGAGINLATLDWCMRRWQYGYRILIVEFTAGDIAAIPTATDGKFRVHRCRIVGEKNLAELGLAKS